MILNYLLLTASTYWYFLLYATLLSVTYEL